MKQDFQEYLHMTRLLSTSRAVFLLTLAVQFFLSAPQAMADYAHAVSLYNNKEYSEAFREFMPLAARGDMDSEQAIGLMYEHGRGVKQDYSQAAYWYEKAAAQGHEIAEGNLGVLYRDGRGVKQDYRKALKWLSQGAMGGDPYAMLNLGAMYANGQVTPADPVEGWAWVFLATQQNVPGAQRDLASISRTLSPSDIARAKNRASDLQKRIDEDDEDSGYQGPASQKNTGNEWSPLLVPEKAAPVQTNQDTVWKTWEKLGIKLDHPAGWTAGAEENGSVKLEGVRGERLIIWPVFSRKRINDRLAVRLVDLITRKLEPGNRLEKARIVKSGIVKANGSWRQRQYTAVMVWTTTDKGDAATYILASAPQASYMQATSDFSRIIQSLSLRGEQTPSMPVGQNRKPYVRYTTFTDPTEGAFTAEVPVGWQVEGGVARFNASDVRPWLRLLSRDGSILVFLGDPNIPSMIAPNRALLNMGFPEGSIYNAGYNQRFLIKSYLPGKQSANVYALNNLSRDCRNPDVKQYRDRPEVSAAINRIFRKYQSPFARERLDTGEISRSCPETGHSQYVFAGTLLSQFQTYQGVFSMWVLNYLYGFDALERSASTALAVTSHMADSFRVTEQWARMNTRTQGDVSAIITETGKAIAKTVSSGFWNAQRSGDRSMEKVGKAILGIQDTIDPLTGDKVEIDSDIKYGWIDHQGHVVGTETETIPNINFRPLLMVDQ